MTSPTRQQALILGLGQSGLAAAELALRNGCAVTVLDERETPALLEQSERLQNRGATVILGVGSLDLPTADFAVISPGIGPDSVLGTLAEQLTCPVISELEYGFRSCACPIIAITGTNGKTTTTELTVHALKHAGYKALAAGNIGLPLTDAAMRSGNLDYLVVEVSSFQLERVEQFAPLAAAFLNLTPDHLDRHTDLASYCALKLRIFDRMTNPKRAVIGSNLFQRPQVAAIPLFADGKRPVRFSGTADTEADFGVATDGMLFVRGEDGAVANLIHRNDVKLKGTHNLANILAAAALCQQIGVELSVFASSLASYAPAAHRLELIASREGVRFVNDSKATNPDALAQGLLACAGNPPQPCVHLIAGGVDKELDFSSLSPLLARCARNVYLIGACRDKLFDLWHDTIPCQKFSSLAAAAREAVDNAGSGDTVLLSPGCASFDMFRDYADRGAAFTQEIHRSIGA